MSEGGENNPTQKKKKWINANDFLKGVSEREEKVLDAVPQDVRDQIQEFEIPTRFDSGRHTKDYNGPFGPDTSVPKKK